MRTFRQLLKAALPAAMLLGVLIAETPAGAVGVQPLVIDLSLSPGQTGQFTLTLVPSGEPERVNLRLYQPVQLLSGDLTYQVAEPATFSAASWVEVEPRSVDVPPDARVTVPGRVTVPFGARGSHTVILMVEPELRAAPGTVGIQIRYAVRLNIRVAGLMEFPRVDIGRVSLEAVTQGPQVRARVKNTTPVDFTVAVEATLRNQDRRLVERIPMLTELTRRTGRADTRIYPGSELEFTGPVTADLEPGRYELRLFVRYADRFQTAVTREIVLEEPLRGSQRAARASPISVESGELFFNVAPRSLATRTVNVTNTSGRPVQVLAFAREVAAGYARSVWPFIRLRTAMPLRLQPGEATRLALTAQPPRSEEVEGGYYGFLVLRAWPAVSDPAVTEPLGEASVLVSLMVGKEPPPQARVESFAYFAPAPGEQEGLVQLTLTNSGSVYYTLTGRLRVEDEGGGLLGEWRFEEGPEQPPVFPGQHSTLVARLPALAPGSYRARVRLDARGGSVLDRVFEFTVEEAPGG